MKTISTAVGLILLLVCTHVKSILYENHRDEHKSHQKYGQVQSDLLTKMHLTQKGYIQFLRYIKEVPLLTEYTFCLWMKSYNLTYSHPLLSYSKHEEERRIRVWISPSGGSINLEINGVEVFNISMKFREHQWYHICQSWSSDDAIWELFVNGRKKIRGYSPTLIGIPIKPGGDIVVGQEYTDFDKGLDDGIEGDIFGFNFVLSATTSAHSESTRFAKSPSFLNRRITFLDSRNPQVESNNPTSQKTTTVLSDPTLDQELFEIKFSRGFHPSRKLGVVYNSAPRNLHESQHLSDYSDRFSSGNNRSNKHKSIGKRLVELSGNCSIGKGAPLHGSKTLISWTKTTVRVFGGVIVKHVRPFC